MAGSAEPLTGLLSIPLSGGANVEFHLEKVILLSSMKLYGFQG